MAKHIIATDDFTVFIYHASAEKATLRTILTIEYNLSDFTTELEKQILVGRFGTKLFNIVSVMGETWKQVDGDWKSAA